MCTTVLARGAAAVDERNRLLHVSVHTKHSQLLPAPDALDRWGLPIESAHVENCECCRKVVEAELDLDSVSRAMYTYDEHDGNPINLSKIDLQGSVRELRLAWKGAVHKVGYQSPGLTR